MRTACLAHRDVRSAARVAAAALLAAPVLGAARGAPAQPVTVGRPQGAGDCTPLGCRLQVVGYEQIYAASAFTGPLTITELAFFGLPAAPGVYVPGTYTFRLGTTAQTLAGLAGRPAANATGPLLPFAVVTFGGGTPVPAVTTVGGIPFGYDPAAGNLLLDVLFAGPFANSTPNPPQFAIDPTGAATRSVVFTLEGGYRVRDVGLVTRFDGTATSPPRSPVPEPATWALLGAGLATLAGATRRGARRSGPVAGP